MTRSPLPLPIADISAFSRRLSQELGEAAPSHLALMNMLARAGGFENVQHLRATQAASRRFEARVTKEESFDAGLVQRALNQFDTDGRLSQWPAKRSVQSLALWALWARLPAGRVLTEREVNGALGHAHSFEDPATLRRLMISNGLLSRTLDGAEYKRVEQTPPPEATALFAALRAQAKP